MKNLMNRIAMMAAGAIVLGTMAYGQDLKANIPFSFRTSAGMQPAGDYRVYRVDNSGGGALVKLSHTASAHNVIVMGSHFDTYGGGSPALLFRCAAGNCELASVRTSNGAVQYPQHKPARNAEIAMVTIPLRVANGD